MIEFIQQIFNGITLGCIYCLLASGLTLVFGVMHVPNFAQGNLYMVGAFIGYYISLLFGLHYWLILLGTVCLLAILGIFIEKILFRPIRDDPPVNSFIVALGLLMILEGLVTILCGEDFKTFRSPYNSIVTFGEFVITTQRLAIILGTIITLSLLYLFLAKTKTGISVIAMSQNRELACMVGINVNRVSIIAFAVSTALAGVAAVLISPLLLVYPHMGMGPLLIAFAAVIFGGLGSIPGAICGAFLMAMAQVFCVHFGATDFSNIAIFGVMITILIFKPTGLMGSRNDA